MDNHVQIGKLANGLECITLTAGGQTLRILPEMGFNAYSWEAYGRELMMEPVDIKEKGCKYGVPALFPTPNRVVDCVFEWDGKKYPQVRDGQPHFIHGLVNNQTFTVEKVWTADDGAFARGSIEFVPGKEIYQSYPWRCKLTLTYQLAADGVHLSYKVENFEDKVMPFGFGIHPFFSKMGDPSKIFIKHPLTQGYEVEDLLPTGKIYDVSGMKNDFTQYKSVAKDYVDCVYTGMDQTKCAEVDYPEWGYRMTFRATDDCVNLVVFTPDQRACFCVENQTCSTNAHNLYARGLKEESHLTLLGAKGTHNGRIDITLAKR